LLRDLQGRIDALRGAGGLADPGFERNPDSSGRVRVLPSARPTGLGQEFDRALPTGGIRPGSLVEWLGAADGMGVEALALACAGAVCRGAVRGNGLTGAASAGRTLETGTGLFDSGSPEGNGSAGKGLLVVDLTGELHPPALRRAGLPAGSVVLVRPPGPHGRGLSPAALWCLEEGLRSPAIGAVWARLIDPPDRVWRRLQLAAESGGAIGVFVRPPEAIRRPVAGELRLLVEALPPGSWRGTDPEEERSGAGRVRVERDEGGWRLRVSVLRCRGLPRDLRTEVWHDDATGDVHSPAGLVLAPPGRRGSGGVEPRRHEDHEDRA
jgi:hypothetical protein